VRREPGPGTPEGSNRYGYCGPKAPPRRPPRLHDGPSAEIRSMRRFYSKLPFATSIADLQADLTNS